MKPDKFNQSITDIFKMACVDLPKAVSQTGYMPNFYGDQEYESLFKVITKQSNDLKDEVFGDLAELDDQTWLEKSMLPEFKWMFSLSTIRQKIFIDSKIPERHINEEEAHKLLARLKQQQNKIREQAVNDEKEEKQKEHLMLNWLQPRS